jgi:hypothetical protein
MMCNKPKKYLVSISKGISIPNLKHALVLLIGYSKSK